jgi:SAM-dependent methyltransferase
MDPMDGDRTNTDQAQAWGGPAGAHWVDNTERYDRMLAPYLAAIVGAAELSATDRVLDVGCGTGALTRTTARLAADGEALGVDLSGRMVAAAREITDAEGPINAGFLEADAQAHAFPAGGHDVLVSRFGVMFFSDPVAAFANLRRATRDGGRLVFAVWQSLVDNEWMLVPGAAAAEHVGLPDGADGGPGPGPFSLAEPDEVRRVLGAGGFAGVELAEVGGPMWMGRDLDDTMSYLAEHELARRLFDGKEPAAVERALGAIRDALTPHGGPDGVVLSGKAWVVTARAA